MLNSDAVVFSSSRMSAQRFLSRVIFKHLAVVIIVALGVVGLSSCNLPTVSDDIRYNMDEAHDEVREFYKKGEKKIDETFDPETQDLIDDNRGLSRKDYERELYGSNPSRTKSGAGSNPKLPDVSKLLSAPRPPIIANDKLVTLSVTSDVPLKEVLIELSRRADIDVEIDPSIQGGIIFRAKEKPFTEVIERISELASLRYSVKNGVLRIEKDKPYIHNYRMNFLNQVRTGSSSVNTSTTIGGGGSTEAGSADVKSGSSSTLSSTSEGSDVWKDIEKGVAEILTNFQARDFSNVVAADGAAAPAAAANEARVLSINKSVGIMSVLATERQHREVAQYLDYVKMSYSSQVLIEAKILEVSLNDQYQSGINWNLFNSNITPFNIQSDLTNRGASPFSAQPLNPVALTFSPAELFGIEDTSLEASISLVERFGTTRTLSSPRVSAMNNQQAILTFAESYVYFDVTIEEEENSTSTGTDRSFKATAEPKSVPIGVILSLQPSIDLLNDEITLSVRPTLSRLTDTVDDPAVALQAARSDSDISNSIPVVEVREMDSVLKVKSGQVLVIGGLMEERSVNIDDGIPGAKDIPWVGRAFKNVSKASELIETVIFIKATIVPPQGVSAEDKELYKKFAKDRRPLF